MKRYLIAFGTPLLFALVFNGSYCTPSERKPVEIIQKVQDDRGLISVVYVQDGDTLALDYITRKELDSLLQK